MKIIVKNLSPEVKREEIKGLFEKYGHVDEISLKKEPYTGGMNACLEMNEGCSEAIKNLNGYELKGNQITVADAGSDDTFKTESKKG